MKSWQPFVAPNHWPDADMLPLGHIALRGENGSDRQSRLTHDEQRTLMTLWAIFRSPLILGGDLPSMLNEPDHWTLNLVTNRDVITLDQRSRDNQCILLTPDLAIWTARTSTPDHFPYLAVFNRSDATQTITRPWSELGLEFPTYIQEDLWTHLILDRQSSLTVTLAPHASALYLLKPEIVATQ